MLGTSLQLIDVNQRSCHTPGHVIQCHHSYDVPVLESPDEHIKEIYEGKLNKGGEDRHEANDDKHVQRCSIPNLGTGES